MKKEGLVWFFWWQLELLLPQHHEACGLSSPVQRGESLASLMQTVVEELSSFCERDLF